MRILKSIVLILSVGMLPVLGEKSGPEEIWQTDYTVALSRSKMEHKVIMLYFAGSDWCKPCILMKRDIFDTDTFKAFANDNLIAVKLDFPRLKKNKLPKELTKQNEAFAEKFNSQGVFPLVVFINENEEVIDNSGYQSGGPEAYIEYLKQTILNN